MKKFISLAIIALAISCKTKPVVNEKAGLYEVLTVQGDGGANIRFYEILTDKKEIAMLQGDENLKGKISQQDLQNSNFIILNMGEKSTAGHSIVVDEVRETADKIIVTVKDTEPEGMAAQVISYPYTIVKINSKKPIEIQ